MINLEKELEAFKQTIPENLINYIEFCEFANTFHPRSQTSKPEDKIEFSCDVLTYEFASWRKRAELANQELESIKAELEKYQSDDRRLDKPAFVGGTVFREGVGEKTVIKAAQRLYESSQEEREAEKEDILSYQEYLRKVIKGDYVLVPKEPTEAMCNAGCDAHNYEIDCFEFSRIYQASIKAVENNHE